MSAPERRPGLAQLAAQLQRANPDWTPDQAATEAKARWTAQRAQDQRKPTLVAPGCVFVVGPQGCGKTLAAPALLKHLRLQRWIDWDCNGRPIKTGTMVLTSEDPRATYQVDCRVLPFDQVMREAGLHRADLRGVAGPAPSFKRPA